MKTPVEWVREFVNLEGISDDILDQGLTMGGLEVEETAMVAGSTVFVTKVTPNRGDLLSITGVARHAAAIFEREFTPPTIQLDSAPAPAGASVIIEAPDLCTRYVGKIVRGVKHGPSPQFIQDRLTQAGMRPLGIVVDVTNYVMLEIGQPLHAFDFAAIPGGEVVIRRARDGEVIKTLDGSDRALTTDMLVIADRAHPIALAGVMGGFETEVSESTTDIFLESAIFDQGVIRRTAKAIGLATEASYRFERVVDPSISAIAAERAAELLERYAGAKSVPGRIDVQPSPIPSARVALRPERVNKMLGLALSAAEIVSALGRLGITEAERNAADRIDELVFAVPTYRPDVSREIDLVEEVGIMIGYDQIPECLPPARGAGGQDAAAAEFESRIRHILIGEGLTEIFTHTLVAPSPFDLPDEDEHRVRVRMALSAELSGLRPSLVGNLLNVGALNVRHRLASIRLFEVGKIFASDGPGKYREPRSVAGLVTGGSADYFTAKGIVENVAAALRLSDVRFEPCRRFGMHPGRCSNISIEGLDAGFVAEVDPDAAQAHLDVPQTTGRIAVFALDGDLLRRLTVAAQSRRYVPLPRFPAITRDLAMVYDISTLYGRIEEAARSAAGDLLESVSLQSVYTGERVPTGSKSVAIRLVLRSPGRTLTDADADTTVAAVQKALQEQVGGVMR